MEANWPSLHGGPVHGLRGADLLPDKESQAYRLQAYSLLLWTVGQAASNYNITSPGTFTAHIPVGSKMAGQYGNAGYTSLLFVCVTQPAHVIDSVASLGSYSSV